MHKTKVYIRFSISDKPFADELFNYLQLLKQEEVEVINTPVSGQDPNESFEQQEIINEANIIILLLSPEFFASDYIYRNEFNDAIKRHRENFLKIIPVILKPCDLHWSKFADFHVLPSNGIPISLTRNPDEAYSSILRAIQYIIKDISASRNISASNFMVGSVASAADNVLGDSNIIIGTSGEFKIHELAELEVSEVFPLNGIPSVTFVEPISFKQLISSIKHKGRGIIIEGPSGVGKTTAIKKAVENINFNPDEATYLTARDPKSQRKIIEIYDWHKGLIIIDDFHRLSDYLKTFLADYLKQLADIETSTKKLIIIGIPKTGTKLISFAHDLATRVDIFEFSKVNDDKIAELIEKGEQALNIKFDKKSDIILTSNGSLSVTQYLCHYSAIEDDVSETQKITKVVTTDLYGIISSVKRIVSRRFDNFIFSFSQLGGKTDRTSIKLLKELALTDNGSINLNRFKVKRPELSLGIDFLIEDNLIDELWAKNEDCKNFLYFDPSTSDLVIDDPQLLFYLNNTTEDYLSNLTGKKEIRKRDKVFISYCHKDYHFFERIMVHLKPLIRDVQIDIWSDKRIKPGEKWNKEIERALEETKVALLLVSADFIASDYISQKELPALIKANSLEGAIIIPIFVKPSNLDRFENIRQYQGINSPTRTIIDLSENEQEIIYVRLSQAVEQFCNNIP